MADCYDIYERMDDETRYEIKKSSDKQATLKLMREDVQIKKELLEKQKAMHTGLWERVQNHPNGRTSGLRSILRNDRFAKETGSNVYYRSMALNSMAKAKMNDLVEAGSTRWLGFTRDKKLMDDVVTELIDGLPSKNPKAAKLAQQWTDAASFLMDRFNAAGGRIGTLEGWGMPQTHDRLKMIKMGKDKWISYATDTYRNTEELDMSAIYDTLISGGQNKIVSKLDGVMNPNAGGKKLANKRADHRVLIPKSGKHFLDYQKTLGTSEDPLVTMLNHIRGMSDDVAQLEILGPDPEKMFNTLVKQSQFATEADKIAGIPHQGGSPFYTDGIYQAVTGKLDMHSAKGDFEEGIAALGDTVRAMQVATKLDAAVISAVPDIASNFVNTAYRGGNPLKAVFNHFRGLSPSQQLKMSKEMGMAAEIFNSTVTKRYSELGAGFWSKASEAVLRGTGLNVWTEASRKAFQYEFHNALSKQAAKSLESGKLHRTFKEFGISIDDLKEIDWKNLQDSPHYTRVLEMILQEGDYATIMGTPDARVWTTMAQPKGNLVREMWSTSTQFMTFPVTFMIQHGSRAFLQGTIGQRVGYTASLLTMGTLLGSLSVDGKDASKGYTPRKGSPFYDGDTEVKDDVKYWSAAFMQAGGLGLMSDFIFSDQNRFGGSKGVTIGGPTAGTISDFWKATYGNAQQATDPEHRGGTNIGSEIIDAANRHANPVNAWYLRMLIDEYMVENLKAWADDEYEYKKNKKAMKRERDLDSHKFEFLEDM